jgi:ADP-heptose:LPS heptosyltransferase
LGDALVAAPLIDGARRAGWTLDVLAMLQPVAQYARALPAVDEVDYFDLFAGQAKALPAVARRRRRKYDIGILPYPATRWQYHALLAACGPKKIASHDYGGLARLFDSFAHPTLVPLRGGHRIRENARLAAAIGLSPQTSSYVLPADWRSERRSGLLGVHAGTMKYKGNEHRRWPLERFAELIRANVERGRGVRIFVGPSEREELGALTALVGGAQIEIVDEPIDRAARLLSECEVFVGNDAGFAHLAAGLGVKTVTLYGMSDPVRSQPVGPSLAVRPSDCPACHDEGMRTFECVRDIGYRCIRQDLMLDDAVAAVDRAFAAATFEFVPVEAGDYRLYGRAFKSASTPSGIESTIQSSAEPSDTASGT